MYVANNSTPLSSTSDDYEYGFGEQASTYYLGNHFINLLTTILASYTLRIDMWDESGDYFQAEFSPFKVMSANMQYKPSFGEFTEGTASDGGLTEVIAPFYNGDPKANCIVDGGWWYNTSSDPCFLTKLTGNSKTWANTHYDSVLNIKNVVMRLRPDHGTSKRKYFL